MNKTEACKILDLSFIQAANISAIKTAYRKLSKIHHPDKGGNCDKMATINEAYEILSTSLTNDVSTPGTSLSLANDIFNFMLANYLLLYSRYTYPNINYYK